MKNMLFQKSVVLFFLPRTLRLDKDMPAAMPGWATTSSAIDETHTRPYQIASDMCQITCF